MHYTPKAAQEAVALQETPKAVEPQKRFRILWASLTASLMAGVALAAFIIGALEMMR